MISDFIKNPEFFKIEKIPTNFDPEAEATFAEALKQTGLCLLGEVHGVAQNPAIIYTLMQRFNLSSLALEWPNSKDNPDLRLHLEEFLSGKPLNPEVLVDKEFGTMTLGHFALLRKLKEEQRLNNLILFNSEGDTWNGRDKKMAQVIEREFKAQFPTIVVCGNLHALTQKINLEDLEEELNLPKENEPMGYVLSQKLGPIPSIRINYRRGEFYNRGVQSFYEQPVIEKARFYKDEDGTFVFDLPEAKASEIS